MKRIVKYISILFFMGSLNVPAQTLEDYLKTAAENNPGIKSKFLSYQASLEKIPQVGALPDPELSFGIFIKPMERYMGNQIAEFTLMQMFPWFGTLSASEDEAAAMSKAKFEEFNEAKSMLFYEVKSTWYSLYFLQKEIGITEENIQILQTLEEIALSRLSSGAANGSSGNENQMQNQSTPNSNSGEMDGMNGMNSSPQTSGSNTNSSNMQSGNMNEMANGGSGMVNVLRVQIEINALRNQLALLNDAKKPLLVQFNRLLNRPLEAFVNIADTLLPKEPPLTVSEIPDSIKLNNPMLRMLEMEEKAFLAQEQMNKKMGFPMIGLGVQYSIINKRPGSMMEGKNMIMPMATISIPLWRSKYNASVDEARLRRDAVIEQKVDEQNRLMVSYEDALKDLRDAERRRELYIQQSTLAQQALKILTAQYTTSGGNFEEVLRMQQQLLDYKLKGLNAIVDQNISSAMLERLMGR